MSDFILINEINDLSKKFWNKQISEKQYRHESKNIIAKVEDDFGGNIVREKLIMIVEKTIRDYQNKDIWARQATRIKEVKNMDKKKVNNKFTVS